jgi:hypothetical protein
MQRRDWIERAIEQLAQALAAIMGLRKNGLQEEAAAQVNDAFFRLGGIDVRLVEMSDARLLAQQVRDPIRLLIVARLARERAELELERGGGSGASWRRKAQELYSEAEAAGAALDEDARNWIAAG